MVLVEVRVPETAVIPSDRFQGVVAGAEVGSALVSHTIGALEDIPLNGNLMEPTSIARNRGMVVMVVMVVVVGVGRTRRMITIIFLIIIAIIMIAIAAAGAALVSNHRGRSPP